MPVRDGFSATFSAWENASELSPTISGTFSALAPPEPTGLDIEGTYSIDAGDWESFITGMSAAVVRVVDVAVTLDGVAVPELVDTVEVDESLESVIRQAAFSLARYDLPREAAGSLAGRALDCTIAFLQGPPGDLRSVDMFSGDAAVEVVAGDYRPVCRFRAVGPGNAIMERLSVPGCLEVRPLQGYTRGQAIVEYFESAGLTVANGAALSLLGKTVKKPIDLGGISPLDLLKRWGEAEGWRARFNPTTGEIEIISEDAYLTLPPIVTFDADLLTAFPEERNEINPVTEWTISTTELTPATAAQTGGQTTRAPQVTGGVDANGLPYSTEVVVVEWDGVEVRRTERTYQVAQAGGTSLGPASYQEVERLEIETTYVPIYDSAGLPHPSAQKMRVLTRTYRLAGIPAASDYPSVYTWTDGAQYTTASASLILWQLTDESFSWSSVVAGDPNDCTLQGHTTLKYEYYSPRVDPLGTHHDYIGSGPGGVVARADTSYQWQVVYQEDESWTDQRIQQPGTVAHPPQVFRNVQVKKFVPVEIDASGNIFESGAIAIGEVIKETWIGNAENTEHDYSRRVNTPPALVAYSSQWTGQAQLTVSNENKHVAEPVPGPPTGDALLPQIAQQLLTVIADFSALMDWPRRSDSELVEYLEDEDDCVMLAARRVRKANGTFYTCESRDLPHLRIGDVVAIDLPDRGLDDVRGWIERITRRRARAEGRQTTVVFVPSSVPALPTVTT